jgi:hypothetical protein
MLSFAWLRKGSAGADQRILWLKDTPLMSSEGASSDELSSEKFMAAVGSLREGGKVVGLVTLQNLSNDFSYPGIKFQSTRLEFMGRKFFTTNKPPALAGSQGVMTKEPGAMMPITDKFFETSDPAFPKSWPGTLPIVVRDLSKLPTKWKLLAADEMVAAFWKLVDFTVRGIQHYKERLSAEPQDSPNIKVFQDKVNLYTTVGRGPQAGSECHGGGRIRSHGPRGIGLVAELPRALGRHGGVPRLDGVEPHRCYRRQARHSPNGRLAVYGH